MKHTPAQRAESLLEIHKGTCSVSADSPLAEPFLQMQMLGKVVMVKYRMWGKKFFNIYSKKVADEFLNTYGKAINSHA